MTPRSLRLTASILCLLAPPALAQDDLADAPGPRVLDTSSDFASGATEVLIDTPSALVWSTYQSGEKDGWYYRIFPDGHGILSRHPNFSRAVTAIRCDAATGCTPVTPPPAAAVPATAVLAEMEAWVARNGVPPAVALAPSELTSPTAVPGPAVPSATAPPMLNASPNRTIAVVTDWTPPTPAAPSRPVAVPPAPAPPAPVPPMIAATAAKPPIVQRGAEAGRSPARAASHRRSVVHKATPPKAPIPTRRNAAAAAPDRFTCTLSGNLGLTYLDPQGGDVRVGKLSGTFGCSYRHPSGLNIRLSMTGYPIASQRSDSDASFSYALSYPLPGGYNLQYASYSAEFPRQPQSVVSAFGQGGFRLSKSLPPLDMGKITGWDALGKMNCQGFAALTPGESPNGGFSCGLTAFGKFTFRATANVYTPGTQSDYQPDYSYSASYTVNDRTAIEYSNYAGNRFPWNSGGNSRGLASGALRVTYRFSF
ncbi:hypothetical protein [Falsirhodobacter sp. 1013]|uniref:hypothetical protein n=1 Tax=Falsirhodobacter sp. 1013 TaxID=3417566 RepID=UPI003EB86AEA